MKIILDESVPQKLRLSIEGRHTVVTTWYQGWSGLKNGALLNAAEEAGFELFITADRGSFGTSPEGPPIAGLTCVKYQGQNGAYETRLRPHQH